MLPSRSSPSVSPSGLSPPGPAVGSVLFACTFNVIRSPMAAGLLHQRLGKRLFVDSCGVRCSGPVDPFAAAVMAEVGVDIVRHRCKRFDELEDTSFDLIISLSPEAHHHAVDMVRLMACEVEYWPTLDPSVVEGSRDACLEAYREVRDTLAQRLEVRFGLTATGSGPR